MTPERELTPPDLVVLSLLSEGPRHGYDVVRELERREVRDWAGISRPQVYYSLRKLAGAGLIESVPDAGASAGPERRVYAVAAEGREALAAGLDSEEWATQRPPPPFLTWAVLSPHARSEAIARVVNRRKIFLDEQIAREEATLADIREGTGHGVRIAEAIVSFAITQFEAERRWLEEFGTLLSGRG